LKFNFASWILQSRADQINRSDASQQGVAVVSLPEILSLKRSRESTLVNGLDTALHITVLLHGLYVGVITTWLHWHDQAVGSRHWHDQMLN
jgi:hypothetical protein